METAVTALSLAVLVLITSIIMLLLELRDKSDKLKEVIKENKSLKRGAGILKPIFKEV